MDTSYIIAIRIRTLQGMQEIGNFFMGADADFAHLVFDGLEGDITSEEDALIRVDLERKKAGAMPVRVKSVSCTLDQYAENCKILIRDLFKFLALEK